jgi:hypothetical protein
MFQRVEIIHLFIAFFWITIWTNGLWEFLRPALNKYLFPISLRRAFVQTSGFLGEENSRNQHNVRSTSTIQ